MKKLSVAFIFLVPLSLLTGTTCNQGNVVIPDTCPTNATRAHVLSTGTPKVKVIEYLDIECSHCGDFARNTFPTIKQQYIDTGKVSWEFRHFPISTPHPHAQKAGEAAECAHDQEKFDQYLDLQFHNQSNLTNAGLKSLADQAGLDRVCFDPCLDGGSKTSRVQDDFNTGLNDGVNATPTFFINGTSVVGFQSVAEMSAQLDAALASP